MRMKQFLNVFGLDRADVENWTSRLTMRTKYAETVPGRAREFSRFNVLELAVTGALVSVGCRPPSAVALAEIVVDSYRHKTRVREWLIAPAQSFDRAIETDDLSTVDFEDLKARSPRHALVMVGTGDIVRKVEKLFSDRAEG